MAFWTERELEPKRAYRFRIGSTGNVNKDTWWWAKSVDKPTFDVNVGEYRLINHKVKVPGIGSWSSITVKIADVGNDGLSVRDLLAELNKYGYNFMGDYTKSNTDGIAKQYNEQMNITISELNSDGGTLGTWNLYGAFIKQVTFGSLDYGSDDISEISIVFDYDYAKYDDKSAQAQNIANQVIQLAGQAASGTSITQEFVNDLIQENDLDIE